MTVEQMRIREKRKILRETYNAGALTTKQLARELGVKDYRTAQKWARQTGVKTIRMGRRIKYDVDDLARVLVKTSW